MKKFAAYLDLLKFDPRLRSGIVFKYLTNIRLVIILIMAIVLFGLFNYFTLNRRLNPEVKIPIVVVNTVLPGASPEEIEALITIPLEQEVQNAKGLDVLESTSQDSISTIVAQFVSSVPVDDAADDVQRLVESVSGLPEEANDPSVNSVDFEDNPVWEFILTSKSGSRATLERTAKQVKEYVEGLPSVDRVIITGLENQEIQVVVPPEKLIEYGLNPAQLATSIQAATSALPAGTVATSQSSFTVSIDPSITSIDELRKLPITVNGATVPLSSLAAVSLKSTPSQYRTYFTTRPGGDLTQPLQKPEAAVKLSVFKTSGRDLVETQQFVEQNLTIFLEPYETQLELTTLDSIASDINDQFNSLFQNFATTIGLVFLTLFIFLGLKQASVASLSIPLTFLISFSVMGVTGQSLNFLTLFSLLLALGLLLDDAIVIIASITEYHRTNKFTATQAGLLVWRDFIVPIWTTTLTTVWAFLPLLLSTGILGEFIKPIPVVVSATLLASTSVAVLVTLPLMMLILKLEIARRVKIFFRILVAVLLFGTLVALSFGQAFFPVIIAVSILLFVLYFRWRKLLARRLKQLTQQPVIARPGKMISLVFDCGLIDMNIVKRYYQKIMRRILTTRKHKLRVVIGIVLISVFSYTLVPLGFVQNVFFPGSDSEIIYLGLELPTGTTVNKTEDLGQDFFADVTTQVPELKFALLEIGQAGVTDEGGSGPAADNQANVSLRITPEEDRERSTAEILDDLRTIYQDYNQAKISIFAPTGGPPAGSDITVKILGDDLSTLSQVATEIEQYLAQIDGVVNISRSIKPSTSKLVLAPDNWRLSELGLTQADAGFWLRTGMSGFELDELTLAGDDDETPITLYLSDHVLTPEEITGLPVLTAQGSEPLSNLGSLSLSANPTKITREDGQRTLVVFAGVKEGFSSPKINEELFAHLDTINLPAGYSFDTGGANEENQKSVQSILQAMILSFILILGTMVIQLGSFRKAVIVIMVIPLAISGVFIIFALTGTPLSFPGLIGLLALFGIVVNNSIVLVDKIGQNVKQGLKTIDAIVDAAGSRLQPIFFSSLTTIIGLIPITLSDPIWEGLGGAIIAGLSFSGLTMLFFIPVIYSFWYSD